MKIAKTRRGGQAAVETAFSIPVLGVVFLIGFQLYATIWTAQGVHVRARYDALAKASHKPCYSNEGSALQNENTGTASATVDKDVRLLGSSAGPAQITQTSYIICKKPGG